jgi:PncC family amidohydrolase
MFDEKLIGIISEHLLANKQTIAVAESVTSGLVQAAISQGEEASGFFQGGITAYNLGQKYKFLSVEPIHAMSCECVSEKVAQQMALAVCRMFLSDYGCAVTGFATTVPEKGINYLYAFIALAYKGKIIAVTKATADKQGLPAQLSYCNKVLETLEKNLVDEKR